jgi:hypothetical protein
MSSPIRTWTATGAVAVVALVGLGLSQTGPGGSWLRSMGIATPSEPYTELAFADPAAPATPEPPAHVRVRFWIHNAEGVSRTYRWTAITRTTGQAARLAGSGALALADGGAATIVARIPIICVDARVRVSVTLGMANQTIGYWQSCPVRS